MNPRPLVAHPNDSKEELRNRMIAKDVRQIPIVDQARRVVAVETLRNLISAGNKENWVFVMAGGYGRRLRPLTEDCPKPMLEVGNKPILETILESLSTYGFHRFYFSVHYWAEMVTDYFGNGSKWGAQTRYVREEEPLGTAGALSLISTELTAPVIVINGDILTKVNFDHLVDFHLQHKSQATICVREYDLQVPFGTVEVDGQRLRQIVEKPVHSLFVNAGIYVLEPSVPKRLPLNEPANMPDLLSELITEEEAISVFPIHEYWMDIGQLEEFARAQTEYLTHFA